MCIFFFFHWLSWPALITTEFIYDFQLSFVLKKCSYFQWSHVYFKSAYSLQWCKFALGNFIWWVLCTSCVVIKCQVRSTVDQLFCHLLFYTFHIHTLSQWLILLFPCMHVTTCGCLLKTLFSSYGVSCSQWLEWCLGIFIVIANVSLLSSFQLTSPLDKLFKDKFLNTFCLLIVSL